MAPSATTWISPEGDVDGTNLADAGDDSNDGQSINEGTKKLYTDAYTHGYTEGYIKGYKQPEGPRKIPIAIVGMSCRLPGNVSTPDEFWELCSRARSGWSEIPKERFENASFHHPNPGKSGCHNAAGGNFLKEDLGLFDAPFFSLTAQEATSMDPQQRLLLECTFEALDSAGIPKHEIVGKEVGVFIGGSFSEYDSQTFTDTDAIPMYQATGCAFAMQSNRLSHFFDLQGPSLTMDTACSSSLVALHQACQSIRSGESKAAIVGGCHLNMLPENWIAMSMSRLFSDEGRSFSFDSRGTGYGRGEGCGILVLKPLDQALKDNDTIRSVIVASGINQDGKTPGITMPNGAAQEALIRSVYKGAGLDPKDTGYVEAHGTGTKVGDPIEAAALHNVFGEGRTARNPLFIGSVKSNIGHLEGTAGVISVIKAAMMLERGFILPNYDFKKPNENIPFAKWHLKVPISQRPWPRPKRFASVNGFGFGGTNAHVVLERAPYLLDDSPESSEPITQPRKLFVLSANDKGALETMMKNVGIYLEQRPEIFQNDLMSNVAYTLGQRRSLLQWRVAIGASSSFELIQSLNSGKIAPVRETEPIRLGFIFTGQGAQFAQMGWGLYEHYPVFSATIDTCDRYLTSLGSPFSLTDELRKEASSSLVNEAHISQPACTAIQLALTDLLRSWGVTPTAVAGHSSGEIGAAYAAGILPLNSCMAIAYYRGMVTTLLKKKFPNLRGSMMAVGCSKEEVEPLLAQLTSKEVRVACYNSPTSLTMSGDEAAINELQAIMEASQMFNRKLQVEMAYHSHHMELVAKDYIGCLQGLKSPISSNVKFHSSLRGHLVNGTELEPSYWVDNLTQSVRFSEALTSMCQPIDGYKTGVNMIVEIGPHSALAGPVKQILKSCGTNAMKILYTSALVRKREAVETALDLASTLFTKGATLEMGAVNLPSMRKAPTLLVDMPRYPWNHQTKYWHESRVMQKHKGRTAPRHDLLGTLANYSNDLEPTWRNILRVDDLPWLRHHKIQSLVLFPMSGFIAMAIEAVSQKATSRDVQFDSFELRDVSVNTPLVITDQDIEMTLQLRPHQEGMLVSSDVWDEFRVHSWAANKGWTEHCKGLIAVKSVALSSISSSIAEITTSEKVFVDKSEVYNSLSELGVSYGPSFQGMNNCHASDSCSMADIVTVDTTQEMPKEVQTDSIIHPALLEQLIEMYWPVIGAGRATINTVYLPSSIRHLNVSRRITALTKRPGDLLHAFCTGTRPLSHPRPIQMSMFATAGDGSSEALITIDDLMVAPIIEREMASESEPHRELCYKLSWEPILSIPCEDAITNGASAHEKGVNGNLNGATNGISNSASGFGDPIVIVHGDSDEQRLMSSKLVDTLTREAGMEIETGTLSDVKIDGKLCLFLAEINEPLLSTLTPEQFTKLQQVLTKVQGILWVVRGAYFGSTNPNANMVTGLSRSIRSETLLKFATLDLDSNALLSQESTVKSIVDVLKATFGSKAEANCELEFMERNGAFFTPRIINDPEMNEYVHKQTNASVLETTPFVQEDRHLQLTIQTPGALETLHFIDQSLEEPLEDDEIEVEVKAIGMNSQDISTAMGQLSTFEFGSECSGIISKTGSKVEGFAIGDRVACISISKGVYSTFTRTKASLMFKVNDDMPFEEAVSIPIAFCTAHYGLVGLGRLEAGESVMINGAASAAGQAAIGLSQSIGAKVFAIVGNAKSKDFLMKNYDLPDEQVSLNNAGLVNKGRFDVLLNCVSADADTLRELWGCMTNFGRFIELGTSNCRIQTTCLDNRSFMSIDIMSLVVQRPKIMSRLMSNISDIQRLGKMKALQTTVFPISDIETAFKVLQAGNFDGKLIVSPQPGDRVKATPSSKQNQLLRPDATYILIGGTGGLGRSMARWMVSKGARNLALISRSGSISGKVKELIDELATVGANTVVRRCDVADKKSVQALIQDLASMPEIRGVIHGAMVLHDVLFEKMTYEQYSTVIESKLDGAWNFHNALSNQKLDFFVALSSAAGAVGNRGQAAYSAANTFLNAFTQYRRSLNLPAACLDLTAVSDAGYLAENAAAAAEVSRNLGSDTICEAEVLALLGAAITGKLESCNGHVITGMRVSGHSAPPFWTPDAKFKHLRLAYESSLSSSISAPVSFNAQLRAAKTVEEAEDVVRRGLCNKLPSVLMLEEEDMDVTRSLSAYALDSLVAIEVRNYITREFEANLQVLELLSSGSIETLAKAICVKSKLIDFK